ncbi:MAG: thiol reductant ABC exporter subunit CydD, partial [Anaerolineae bacterium]
MLFERRLLQQGQSAKWLLILAGLCAVAGGFFALFQAQFFSRIIQKIFLEVQPVSQVGENFLGLALVLAARAILLGGQEVIASRAAFQVKQAVRQRLISHLSGVSHWGLGRESSGEVSQMIIEGVDALEPYFSQYLPQAVVAFWVPPILCLTVFQIDPLSGIVFVITAPLIPFFMRLIADVSERQTQRQWGRLSQLSAFLFDALQGLVTIKRLGKSAEIANRLAEKGEEYRQATLETLRTTFLSALVMEMLSTLSTAVVAVQVGLRLLYGWISFEQAMFVLVLAPEVYLPLRLLGQRFHAGMSGVAAWKRIAKLFELPKDELREEVLDEASGQTNQASHCFGKEIVLRGISFAYPNKKPTLQNIHAKLPIGTITVLVGESGAGKTTLLNLVLRLIRPTTGQILIDGKPIEAIPLAQWWEGIGVAPQQPFLFQGTVRENLAFAKPDASLSEIQQAARLAYADEFIEQLPKGYETLLGENGYGLSAGEKQRLVLARAYLKNAPLLILDESTANVDPQSLAKICLSLQEQVEGRAILIVSHQPQVWEIGQRFWVLRDGYLQEMNRQEFETSALRKLTGAQWNQTDIDARELPVDRRWRLEKSASNALAQTTMFPSESFSKEHPFAIAGWKPWLHQMWSLRAWISLAVLLGWAAIFSNVGLLSTSAYIIAFAALQPSIALLQTAIVGVRFFGISRGVFRYLERLMSHRVTLDLLSKMRVWFYRALEPRVPQLFGRYGSGELLSRLIGDLASLEPFYVRAIAPVIVAFFIGVGMFGWLYALQPALAWIGAGFYLFAFLLVLPLEYVITLHLGAAIPTLRGKFNEQLVLFLQGMVDLKVNRRLGEFSKRLLMSAKRYGKGVFRFNALISLQGVWMNFLAYFAMWVTLWVAAPLVWEGALSGLSLAGLGLGVWSSFEAFLLLPQAVQHFVSGRAALSRLGELVSVQQGLPVKQMDLRTQIMRCNIKVEQVSYHYPESEENPTSPKNGEARRRGIESISFELSEGQRLGIVGRSGSGKTTLVNLLLGLIEPQSGVITIDGADLLQYDLT